MATASGGGGGGGGLAPPAAAAAASQNPATSKNELSPVLQQLNLESIRTRAQDLFNAISRILHTFQTSPQHKWSEVLSQFSMVNIELLTFVEDIKPILKMFVVHPKNVNAESAQILPIMLSSKLLPEMEAEETSLKEQTLLGLSNLPIHTQTEKLQIQIEMVRAACEIAEKELAGGRKLYGLGSRQVPVITPPLDKAQAAKISEQEKLLRAAANYGEGLRLPPSERQQASSLPAHLVHALSSGEGAPLPYSLPGFPKGITSTVPSAVGTLSGTSQQSLQATTAQLLNRSTHSPLPMLGATSLDGTSASPMPYANSPRSGNAIMNEASPQQQQQQTLLQRQKLQQMQKQQQMQHQQQQLRQPAAPPITQSQIHQLQQQQHAHLQQHIQDRQQLQQLQLQQQQQALHQQLQSNSLPSGQQLQANISQNQLAQASQVKSHLGQLSSNPANSLFSATQSSVLSSNMMANLSQTVQPQPLLQQRLNFGVGMQPQRNLASQMLSDPMYNTGIGGSQNSANLGLPLQQQLGQSNFSNILNSNQNMNFGQQRQPPPSQ